MDTELDRLLAAVDEGHHIAFELRHEHANNPKTLALMHHLTIVYNSLNAARGALTDCSVEASKLRSMGVNI